MFMLQGIYSQKLVLCQARYSGVAVVGIAGHGAARDGIGHTGDVSGLLAGVPFITLAVDHEAVAEHYAVAVHPCGAGTDSSEVDARGV